MSPGRKPKPRPVVKRVFRRLHPLRSYTAHDSLRALIRADLGDAADDHDLGALITAARDALNEALRPHGLRLNSGDVFLTCADYDHDSDLRIGRALADLDVERLAAQRRLPVRH